MFRLNTYGELDVRGFSGWGAAGLRGANRVRGRLTLARIARRRDSIGERARVLCVRLYGTKQP